MNNWSSKQQNTPPTSPHQQDAFHEALEHLRNLQLKADATQQRLDVVCSHVFNKPESSKEKNKECVPNNDHRKEKTIWTDTVTGNYVPLLHHTSFTGPL
jgi:hypothetical protein